MLRIPLIDWVVTLAQVALVVLFRARFVQVEGGGVVFFGLIVFLFYFSYIHKVYRQQLSHLALAAISLVGLHALAYFEYTGQLPGLLILGGYFLLSLIFSGAVHRMTISVIRNGAGRDSVPDTIRQQMIRNIAAMFGLVPLIAIFLFALPGGLIIWLGQESRLVQTKWVTITTLGIFWQAIGAFVHRILLKKLASADILYVIKPTRKVTIPNFQRTAALALLSLFVVGTVAETGRDNWVFWIGSFAFWTLTLQNNWYVWRHVLRPDAMAEPTSEVAPGYNIREDFRIFLYSIIIAAVYGIGLAILLGVTMPKRF